MTTNLEELDDIPVALRDRFPVTIRIDRPHPGRLQSLSSDLRAGAALGGVRRPFAARVAA